MVFKEVGVDAFRFVADKTVVVVDRDVEMGRFPGLEKWVGEWFAFQTIDDNGIEIIAFIILSTEDDHIIRGNAEHVR